MSDIKASYQKWQISKPKSEDVNSDTGQRNNSIPPPWGWLNIGIRISMYWTVV